MADETDSDREERFAVAVEGRAPMAEAEVSLQGGRRDWWDEEWEEEEEQTPNDNTNNTEEDDLGCAAGGEEDWAEEDGDWGPVGDGADWTAWEAEDDSQRQDYERLDKAAKRKKRLVDHWERAHKVGDGLAAKEKKRKRDDWVRELGRRERTSWHEQLAREREEERTARRLERQEETRRQRAEARAAAKVARKEAAAWRARERGPWGDGMDGMQ